MIPLQYLQELAKILDIKDMSAGEDLKQEYMIIFTDRIVLKKSHDHETGFSFVCWMMWLGLDERLKPKVLKSTIAASLFADWQSCESSFVKDGSLTP